MNIFLLILTLAKWMSKSAVGLRALPGSNFIKRKYSKITKYFHATLWHPTSYSPYVVGHLVNLSDFKGLKFLIILLSEVLIR